MSSSLHLLISQTRCPRLVRSPSCEPVCLARKNHGEEQRPQWLLTRATAHKAGQVRRSCRRGSIRCTYRLRHRLEHQTTFVNSSLRVDTPKPGYRRLGVASENRVASLAAQAVLWLTRNGPWGKAASVLHNPLLVWPRASDDMKVDRGAFGSSKIRGARLHMLDSAAEEESALIFNGANDKPLR